MKYKLIFSFVFLLSLIACSQLPPKKNEPTHPCSNLNWHNEGFIMASQGQPFKNALITTNKKLPNECRAYEANEDYLNGYQDGLKFFCTPSNGLQWGIQGKQYFNICPKKDEFLFLKKYQKGLILYKKNKPIDTRKNIESIEKSLEETLSD